MSCKSEGSTPVVSVSCTSDAFTSDNDQKPEAIQEVWSDAGDNTCISDLPLSLSFKDDHKFKTPAVPPRRLKDRPNDVPFSRKPRSSVPSTVVGRLPESNAESNQATRGLSESSQMDLEGSGQMLLKTVHGVFLFPQNIPLYNSFCLQAVLQHLMSTNALCAPSRQPMDPEALKRRNDMERIRLRAAKRTKAMIADCRMKIGQPCVSSDEEDDDLSIPITKSVTLHTARSTLYTPHMKDLDLHQPTQMDDIKTMLKKFRKLRKEEPHAPSLDITGIDLDDVYERAGVLAQSEKIKQTMEALEKNLKK
uniref:BHLH domain-containing protein n=1 Tax=Angiostrongylus cantonensis TaxID=6313 RepID=A0A0K0DIU4_ANGCA